MNRRKITRAFTGACATGLLLTACGGGGGGDGGAFAPVAPGSQVPLSATASADGAFDFVASVAANRDDGAEPLVLGDAVLATSETDEPRTVQ